MTTQTDLPNSPDAERALVGSALIDPTVAGALAWINPEMFYLHRHRFIWQAAAALSRAGQDVDYITVTHRLDEAGQLAEVGGGAYLARLMTETPTAQNAEAYARIVDRDWRRRRVIAHAALLARAAYAEDDAGLAALLADGARGLAASAPSSLSTVSDVALEVWDYVSDPSALADRMVPTGLNAWDVTLGGGLERGTLSILMARPGMGKTAALVQIADYVSAHVGPVVFFSKEMNARQILLRMACRRARVSALALRQGRSSEECRAAVLAQVAELSNRDTLYLDDSTPQTTDDVLSACGRLAHDGGLALVLADHLRLFSDRAENENKRLGSISWALKRLAKSLDVAVLAAAQLNRNVEGQENKKPDLKDLRDSGEIEENADTVTALYRENYYSASLSDKTAEFINRKAREGERNARAQFVFMPEYMSFEPLALRVAP